MPARSKIHLLPEAIRTELERRLITSGFSNYDAIAKWLRDQEYDISRSAVHRFGQDFAAKCEAIREATERAKAIVATVGDDEGNMNEALIRLIQQLTFDILINKQDADIAALLPKMGVMVAKISKASVEQKKWMADVRERARKTADDVMKVAKAGGMSESTAKEIRQRILGIV